MITNQRQYLNTQAQAERFRQALAAPDREGLHPKAAKAMRDGLRSQLEDLEGELAEYDALRRGQVATLEAESIVGIGEVLIKARIVRNLTQKELAELPVARRAADTALRGDAVSRRSSRAVAAGGRRAQAERARSVHA